MLILHTEFQMFSYKMEAKSKISDWRMQESKSIFILINVLMVQSKCSNCLLLEKLKQ